MELFLALLLITLIIILVVNQGSLKTQLLDISRSMNLLYREINLLKKEIEQKNLPAETIIPAKARPETRPLETAEALPEKEEEIETLPALLPETPVAAAPETVQAIPPPLAQQEEPVPQPVTSYTPQAAPVPAAAPVSLWERWLKNNPDLEKFIGENLINKIGIGILVLGIAFFVKYAIDKEWINEMGRVGIGMLCGALLVGIGHRLHKVYRSFSSVLAGGGIAVFYFTIAFAFHQYHLLSQPVAFIAMILITIFAIVLSLRYDRLELAIIATVGGFLTPFLVSTGSGNYVVLFTYLLILNSGIATLAYFKRWTALNIISLVFTQIIFGSWMGKTIYDAYEDKGPAFPAVPSFGFATAFYLLFLGMNVVNQIRYRKSFSALDFSIILLLTGSYFAAGMISLDKIPGGDYKGLFTISLAVLQLLLLFLFRSRNSADRNLQYLLYGLTVTFATLAIPVQFDGSVITMFWLAEFVLMLWLFLRMGMPVFKYAAAILLLMASVSLLRDWGNANAGNNGNLVVLFTGLQGIMTNLVSIAAFITAGFLVRKYREKEPFYWSLPSPYLTYCLWSIGAVLTYLSCIFSVNLVFVTDPSFIRANTYHQIITFLAAYLLMTLAVRNRRQSLQHFTRLTVPIFCFLFYVFSLQASGELLQGFLHGSVAGGHLLLHWLAVILLFWNIYYAIQKTRAYKEPDEGYRNAIPWLYAVMFVALFSIECFYLFLIAGRNNNNEPVLRAQFYKAGLSVLWGLCSFAMMWLGMRHKFKPLRIISLTLFSVVLVKLFVYDIRNVSETGKIIAFILLGVLLLLVSFMYQKLKKIIIDDQKSRTGEAEQDPAP